MLRVRLPIPRFVSAGDTFAGRGSLAALRGLEASRALVLLSPSLAEDAAVSARIQRSLSSHATEVVVAAHGEPTLEMLKPALGRVYETQPDWIVAIGGGSVLDAGKLLWLLYEQPDADISLLERPFSLSPLRGKCRFAAVPTTAGTGSEVSSTAVLATADGAKTVIVSHELLPDVAILDPDLTVGVPPGVVASAGFDALAHAIEGYVSRQVNPLADAFAEKATDVLIRFLPLTWRDPRDADARLAVMQAAMMAGWVQNLKVPGVGHAIAHQMGRLGIRHGDACGALLVPALVINGEDGPTAERLDRLAAAIGLAGRGELTDRLLELREQMHFTSGLAALARGGAAAIEGVRDRVVGGALADVCARFNPREVDAALVLEVLDAAL